MNKIQREVYMGQSYNSGFPYWLRLFIFLKRGTFNGPNWSIRISRVFCWFDRHKKEDAGYAIRCWRCGLQEEKRPK